MTATAALATLRALHRAAADLHADHLADRALARDVSRVLAHAVGNADDTFAGQDDVCEEAWAEKALGSAEVILCGYRHGDATPAWFIAQGFTF
jgi:hypothetical protein